jgi:hypothetical protein
MKKLLIFLAFLLSNSARSYSQAIPTAQKTADVQLGVTFSGARPDYGTPTTWHGYGFYGDLDLRYHLGIEFDFHQLSGPDPVLYERTYEVGGRYLYPIHNRFVPYAKVMVGRGVFNFAAPDSSGNSVQIANLAYNTQSIGGGLDLHVLPGLNVRVVDYEYQRWGGFPPRGLNPNVFSVGIAYHFHGKMGLKN